MQLRFSTKKVIRLVQCWLVALCLGVAVNAPAEDWVYTVRPGDNLWDICARYVESVDCWRKVAERNEIANPRHLPPGKRLYLPVEWLKARTAQAAVLAFEGDVEAWRTGVKLEAVRAGLLLTVGDEIRVGEGSVTLRFGDGSELIISPNSQVRLDTLTVYGDIGMADTRVRLDRGRARAKVNPSRSGASKFHIITPAAVAAARGTEFRVSYDADGVPVMRTEVISGEVTVGDQEFAQLLLASQAVKASSSEGVGSPVQLLPAPDLQGDLPTELALFPWTFAWHELQGAEQYRLEVYRNNGKRERFGEYLLSETQVTFDYLDAGAYLLVLRALDADLFEGQERVVTLNVKQPMVLNTPQLRANHSRWRDRQTVHWHWQAEDHVKYYELAITATCDGATSTRYERIDGDSFTSQHPGCSEVSAEVAPWVQGQSHARSNSVAVSLSGAGVVLSVLLIAATLALLAL